MDRFDEIRAFVRVVESGSFSAAAGQMNRAKSVISRRIKALERRLNASLISRTTRRISLTESGQVFYAQCVRLLADLDEAEQMVASEQTELRGDLRIAAPLTFGRMHLAPALIEFTQQHPDLRLVLDFNDHRVDLVEAGLDVAIRIGRLQDSSLLARRLAPVRRILCASPAYLERMGLPESPDDLTQHRGLAYTNMSAADLWCFGYPDGQQKSISVPTVLSANNGEFLMSAAISGLGLLTLPTFMLSDSVDQRHLVPLLQNYPIAEEAIFAVYPPGRSLSRRVRVFIDFLVQRFGDQPYWDRGLNL